MTTLSIQLKALFLLLVFITGWITLCHCHHSAATPKAVAEKHDCCKKNEVKEDKQEKAPCQQDDGSCKYKGIEFNSLAKEMAENIAAGPVFFSLVAQHHAEHTITSISINSINGLLAKEKWRKGYSPDLLILKQSFLI